MDREEKEFGDYLKNFTNVADSLTIVLSLANKMEDQKSFAKEELLSSMKREISARCSKDFIAHMKKDVSNEIKNINLFRFGEKTNLDYLVEVIFIPLTSSSYVIGLQHFIAPGNSYEESCEFCGNFFRDFIQIKDLFGVEVRECPDVKIGYAVEFYKP